MIPAEAKLALTEFLVGSDDVSVCGRESLAWLERHAGVTRVLLAAGAEDPRRLWGVASLGLSPARTGEFTLHLDDRRHPLVAAAWSASPTWFPPERPRPESPLEGLAFHAIPMHPDGGSPPVGLLLIEGSQVVVDADVLWFAQVLGEKLQRLRVKVSRGTIQFLDRERQLLYSIINAVTDPILLTDSVGKLLVGNASAEALFALKEDTDSAGRRHAVELNNLFFSSALAGQMVGDEPSSAREVILVSPDDGSDMIFELLATPIAYQRDETAVVSVLRNVTDLFRARQELEDNYTRLRVTESQMREERNRLDLIVDSVVDPIIVTDPGGDILMTNAPAERFFTAPRASDNAQRHVQANVAQLSSFVAGLLLSGSTERARARISLKDPATGRPVPMEAIAGTMRKGRTELTGVVTVLHDETEAIERERLYEELQRASTQLEMRVREATAELAQRNELLQRQALELEQASAAKSQFLANVSHEFRTPLNAILGYTFMLLGGFYGTLSEEQTKTVTRIDANSRHLATLINDVLDIERIEAGRMPVELSTFGMSELVAEVLEELQAVVSQSPVHVRSRVDESLSRLRSDRQKVKQILVNLLSNALKFTREGEVEIAAEPARAPGRFAVRVRDTGIGIAASDRELIFEPFQQANRVTARALGGTGLGLNICRRLAQMLGGNITVESELGRGSTFTVELPMRVRARSAAGASREAGRRQSA